MSENIPCDDLDEAIEHYTKQLGYRLDMITPADAPREALVSQGGETVRLVLSTGFSRPAAEEKPPNGETPSDWITGRAGMEYRDLIPGRLGGNLIASYIRLTEGGEVPDYVHYHKVRFQMIYCVRGAIKVVYEDQGEPFWLHPGDCVLQPPEIRHRVLWAEADSEVVEIGMPAVHETWVEHDLKLPTDTLRPTRIFSDQRFVRHIAKGSQNERVHNGSFQERDTGILAASNGIADVRVITATKDSIVPPDYAVDRDIVFCFVLKGGIEGHSPLKIGQNLKIGDVFLLNERRNWSFKCSANTQLLIVAI